MSITITYSQEEIDNEIWLDVEGLQFYDNWNEIMPVVIKIESFGGDENELDIFSNCVQLGDKEFVGKTKLEAVIKAVNWWVSQHCT